MMNPFYPCGKPCLTGTHNKKVKKLTLFFAFIKGIMGIMMELRLRNLNPVRMLSVLQLNKKNSIAFPLSIVIHKSDNLIGTLRSSDFGPK